jgi:uncharacterized SAM-binding protein YcdF (DUF218 family)
MKTQKRYKNSIVVVLGDVNRGEEMRARTLFGMRLAKKHGYSMLLSGGMTGNFKQSEARAMYTVARKGGFRGSCILENSSTTTAENAENCMSIINDLRVHRVYLVTSAPHLRRALRLFKLAVRSSVTGVQLEGVPVYNTPSDTPKGWKIESKNHRHLEAILRLCRNITT